MKGSTASCNPRSASATPAWQDTPGYSFAPPGDGPFPTILHIGGYDNIAAEELYASVYPALDRGWAFVGLDGRDRAASSTTAA